MPAPEKSPLVEEFEISPAGEVVRVLPAGAAGSERLPWQDVRIALIASVLLVVLIGAAQWLWFLRPLRLVLGIAYIMFAPGYFLTATLFPRDEDLDGIERVGLGLGLSVAWVPVLALILDRLPWGLRLWPVVVGYLVSVGVFAAAALWRRGRLPAEEAYAPEPAFRPRAWWRNQPPPDRNIYRFIFVAMIVLAVALAWTFLVPTPDEFMTEFYMLGAEGLAESYPREAAVGEEIGVTLGVTNRERGARTYRAEAWAIDPWSERERVQVAESEAFEVPVGGTREWPVTWKMPWAGDDQVVEILLFDGRTMAPYRTLRLWLNVTP